MGLHGIAYPLWGHSEVFAACVDLADAFRCERLVEHRLDAYGIVCEEQGVYIEPERHRDVGETFAHTGGAFVVAARLERRESAQVRVAFLHEPGDLRPLPPAIRASIRAAARVSAGPIAESIAPIHDFIDIPPTSPSTAIDRDEVVALILRTLDPGDARRLARAPRSLIAGLAGPA